MKVKDQIKVRREQLGVSVAELAKRLGVSGQAIRHWENGRSFPGKSKTAALETALSFTLDWTEGSKVTDGRPPLTGLVEQKDVDLLMLICRLPPPAKVLIGDLVEMHLTALDGGRKAFSERVAEGAVPPFRHRQEPPKGGEKRGKTTTARNASRTTRRKAA